jgi:two-component system sensor histidine kinase BaeS
VTIKLFHKVFAAFLITVAAMMVILAVIVQYAAHQNFADYVRKVELSRLDELTDALAAYYARTGSWDTLAEHRRIWHDFLGQYLPENKDRSANNSDLPPPRPERDRWSMNSLRAPERADFSHGPPPHLLQRDRPPPDHFRFHPSGEPPDGSLGTVTRSDRRAPPPEHRPPPPRPRLPPPPRGDGGISVGRRLALFDADKNRIRGAGFSTEDTIFREIRVNGQVVGFLGLLTVNRLSHPLNVDFLREQTKALVIAVVGLLLLAGMISYLLSRRLLAPVQKLAKGTRRLALFDFGTRITVRTRDELGQLAEDFNTMASTLERYESMRRRWISDIAHELRTPLSILRGEIEAMQDGLREPTPEGLQSLHSEVMRLGNLVDDLHQLSVIDSQKASPNLEAVQPVLILRQTVGSFRARLERSKIAVLQDVSAKDDVTVKGDEDRLIQLFTNLLENTLRYTDSPGELHIHDESSNGRLRLVFEDSPPGVPTDTLNRIFDRLYRVDKSRSRSLGGSGLGLAICKEIVEMHRGAISADHAETGGLRIEIEFPTISDNHDESRAQ